MTPRCVSMLIPGEPYALKRARATKIQGHARLYDPPENRSWKAYAASFMRASMSCFDLFTGPVRLVIEAEFTMPKSRWLKSKERPEEWHTKRPDISNLLKAIEDAATGIIWLDDSQVCSIEVSKITLAQGQAPGIWLSVTEAGEPSELKGRSS